ncbi:MAG: hypothetical protein IJL99_04955 [Firmicutes bacterium]|nr:hypothetical protein [Bacillota bacterium]
MNRNCRKILSIIVLLVIFVVGATTAYNCRGTIKEVIETHNYLHCKSELESALNERFQWRNQWINVNGLFQRCVGTTIVRGGGSEYDVYKMSNGQIMYRLPERDMTKYAKKVTELDRTLEEKGIHFLYVQLPNKIKDNSYMPPGTKTYGNLNADQMVQLLRDENIDLIDLREEIEAAGFDWSSLFFKTDHHWTPKTGLWASGLIMKHISEKYGFEINEDYYDYDNYKSHVKENWMLGAVGRRTGAWYDGLDDIEILEPKFDTDFSFWAVSDAGVETRGGNFWNTMYLWDNLKTRSDFVNNSYSTYIGKEFAINTIKNKKAHNGLKVLLIKESFSGVLMPFISLNSEELTAVDLRRYKDQSIIELCDEMQPDLVILAYNPSAFSMSQFRFIK